MLFPLSDSVDPRVSWNFSFPCCPICWPPGQVDSVCWIFLIPPSLCPPPIPPLHAHSHCFCSNLACRVWVAPSLQPLPVFSPLLIHSPHFRQSDFTKIKSDPVVPQLKFFKWVPGAYNSGLQTLFLHRISETFLSMQPQSVYIKLYICSALLKIMNMGGRINWEFGINR